jgi:hypothetical protein
MMKTTTFALLVVASFGLTTAAHANPVIVYDNAAVAANQTTYTYGLEFNVTTPVHIAELGAFDSGSLSQLVGWDGRSGVTVGIFDRTTESLVGTSVLFTGTNGTQINGDAFLPVSFNLPVGSYMVVASNISAYNNDNSNPNPTSTENSVGGAISFVGGGNYISGSTFTYPTSGDGGPANRYDAGTFIVTPEPASFVLAALGVAGLFVVARRRKV